MATDPDSDLYVAVNPMGRVVRFDPTRAQAGDWQLTSAPGEFIAWVACDTSGNVFALIVGNISGHARIVELSASGGIEHEWNESSPGGGTIRWATAVAVDAQDDLFLLDAPRSEAIELTPDGRQLGLGHGLRSGSARTRQCRRRAGSGCRWQP
jgi:hypothetical protein